MGQVSAVLRNYSDKVTGRKGFGWWCPGCKHMHYVPTDGGNHPVWGFDGNLEAPTFTPSYRAFVPAQCAEDGWPAEPERTTCHCFVKIGNIEFLSDSPHALSGQTVPMTKLETITGYGWGYE